MRDLDAVFLTCLQQAFAENTAAKFSVCSGRRTQLPIGLKLEEFDLNEPEGDWPFHELVGCLMWRANQTRPNITNAVRTVGRYANMPREVHWRATIGILEYVVSTSDYGIYFQSCSALELVACTDANYGSKAVDSIAIVYLHARLVRGGLALEQRVFDLRPSWTRARPGETKGETKGHRRDDDVDEQGRMLHGREHRKATDSFNVRSDNTPGLQVKVTNRFGLPYFRTIAIASGVDPRSSTR